jgi:hypothetical protein
MQCPHAVDTACDFREMPAMGAVCLWLGPKNLCDDAIFGAAQTKILAAKRTTITEAP